MKFKKGDIVQAVDEVGRWEEAKIKDVLDGERYMVKFVGWRNVYNRVVDSTEVRELPDPLEEYGNYIFIFVGFHSFTHFRIRVWHEQYRILTESIQQYFWLENMGFCMIGEFIRPRSVSASFSPTRQHNGTIQFSQHHFCIICWFLVWRESV